MARARPRGRPRSFDREAALERAMEVFWRQGYEATSVSELTTAMGITPPSLYAAFGDKERLFLEAVERYRSGPGNSAQILAGATTARDLMERLLEAAATEFTSRSHPPGCMVVFAALNGSAASARVQAVVAKYRAEPEALIRARLQRAIDDGELFAGTSAAALAKFFMTVIQGMTIQARDGATRGQLRKVAEAAMRVWPDT